MFKKLLLKSAVGATAVGSALAVSLVATPAVVTSAPEIQNVACGAYAATVPTSAKASVASFVTYGQSATVTAKVSGPKHVGRVQFVLRREGGGKIKSWSVALRRGQASVSLPRLAARSGYKIGVRYDAPDCVKWKDSRWNPTPFSVFPAAAHARVNAPDVWTLNAARASAVVSARPVMPAGKVRFVLKRGDRRISSITRTLSSGKASVSFGKLRTGRYTVRVVYLGSRNLSRDSGSTSFRVTR